MILVSLSGRPTRNSLRIVGDKGSLHVDLYHGFSVLERGAVSRRHKALRPFARSLRTLGAAGANLIARTARWEPAYPGLRELVKEFYGAVEGARPAPISAEESLDVARARDTVIRIMEAGNPRSP